jgi:hypothetical protein
MVQKERELLINLTARTLAELEDTDLLTELLEDLILKELPPTDLIELSAEVYYTLNPSLTPTKKPTSA